MAKIWRKAIEQELDEKDVELLNILAKERKFEEGEIKDFAKKLKISVPEVKKRIETLKKKKILLEDKVSINKSCQSCTNGVKFKIVWKK